MCEAIDAGKLEPGNRVVMVGFGAGLTWASCAIDWTATKPGAATMRHRAATGRLRFAWAGVKSFGTRVARRVDSVVSKALDVMERKQVQ